MQGLSYRRIDISDDPAARRFLESFGFSRMPVVVTPHESWSGFRPDKLAALKSRICSDLN
ncbi:hypothetical protein [Arthrobacter sp. Y-9]|uniref:hypothetical protein n=1 Tax=Arthrobacter sp. Y-9 TaxID=3039385 RepID=UPI00325ACA15